MVFPLLLFVCFFDVCASEIYGGRISLVPIDHVSSSCQPQSNIHPTCDTLAQAHTQHTRIAREQVYNEYIERNDVFFLRENNVNHVTYNENSRLLAQDLADYFADEDNCWDYDPSYQRAIKRRDALCATSELFHETTTKKYTLDKKAYRLLKDFSHNPLAFVQCTGTAMQHELHQELVDIVTKLSETPKQTIVETSTMLEFVDAAREFNMAGEVYKASTIADCCWAVLEGAFDGVALAVKDMAEHPVQAAMCIMAGEYVLAYQFAKVLYNVAELGVLAIADPPACSKKWNEHIAPIDAMIGAIANKELSLRDSIKIGTQCVVGFKAQSKLLGGLGKWYNNTKVKAVAFAKKHPTATLQEYMATPEGMVFKVASESKNINKNNYVTASVGSASQSKRSLIKQARLPTNKGYIRYVPPKNYYPSQGLPRVKLPDGKRGFLDKFGNVWVAGPSRTKGQDFEWDVQLSEQGKRQLGHLTRDNKHLNVSLDGRVTHR